MNETIKANTCPYCGAAYTLAAGGCVAKCAGSVAHHRLIREWLDAEERRHADGDYSEP